MSDRTRRLARSRGRRLRERHPGIAGTTGVFVAALCAFLAIGAALPVLPAFVRGPLHSSDLAVGIVVGSFALTSVVCRPIAGRQADARGRRAVLVAGAMAMTLGGLLYLLAGGVPSLILARLAVGAGEGAVYTAGATWAVDLAPADRRGLALGLFGLAVWGGLSLGPLAGELLRSQLGYDAVWALTAALPAAGALIAMRLPEPGGDPAEASPGPVALLPRAARRPGIALALANVGYAALAGFVVLHLKARGIGGGASVFTAFALAVFASRLVLSRVPDRAGARATATTAAATEAAGLLVIAAAHSLALALVGAVVVGVGFSMLFPALALMVVGTVGDDRRGSAMGAFTAFFDVGVGLGGPIAGVTASLAGYPAVFVLSAIAAIAAAALALTPRGAKPARPAQPAHPAHPAQPAQPAFNAAATLTPPPPAPANGGTEQ
jgi:MFS family permease